VDRQYQPVDDTSGKLKLLIDKGLRGQTSIPLFLNKPSARAPITTIRSGNWRERVSPPFEIYDELTVKDVQDAADLFRGVYEETQGLDGYVSLEINPKLANELGTQLKEGKRLWQSLIVLM